MDKSIKLALKYGVSIGAHPAYPDLMGFGRRSLGCSLEEVEAMVIYQIGALYGFVKANGARLRVCETTRWFVQRHDERCPYFQSSGECGCAF